jgi:hypothetical protein
MHRYVRKALIVIATMAAVAGFWLATPVTAGASPPRLHTEGVALLAPGQDDPPPTIVDVDDPVITSTDVLRVDPLLLSFLVGSLMPLLTALLTKVDASSAVKGTLNILLSIVGGGLAAFVSAGDAGLTTYQLLAACITAYLSSQALYTGFWRAVGATRALASSTKGVGLG